jgi:hypothetical protein
MKCGLVLGILYKAYRQGARFRVVDILPALKDEDSQVYNN